MLGTSFSLFGMSICGIEGLDKHTVKNVSHVLSILEPGIRRPHALVKFAADRLLELRFHDVIVPGGNWVPPDADHIEQILLFGRQVVATADPAHLLIHCYAGLSRSTAAAALCFAQAYPTRTAYEVLGEVVRHCPRAWPNLLMLELGDEALGRHGELIAAAGALYRRAIDSSPSLGEHWKRQGRYREVALAERWR